jgi:hypothetical protein
MTLTDKKIESVIDIPSSGVDHVVNHSLWREWGVTDLPRCTLTATVVESTGSGYIILEITDLGPDRLRFRVFFHVWPGDEGQGPQDEFKVTTRFVKGTTLSFRVRRGDHCSEDLTAKIRCTTERIGAA